MSSSSLATPAKTGPPQGSPGNRFSLQKVRGNKMIEKNIQTHSLAAYMLISMWIVQIVENMSSKQSLKKRV